MKNLKSIFFFMFLMVIGSFKATADLPLPMANGENSCLNTLTETREFLAIGDSILLIGFLLWVAYIIFCFPKNTFKKM